MTQEELNELASDCRLAFGYQANAFNDGVDAMLRAAIAQAQAAEPVKSASGAILGVRVHGDTVIIKIRGGQRWGNQWARELCHKILTDREPGGNPNAFNKWS